MKPKNKFTIDELYNTGFRNIGKDEHNHYTFHNSLTGQGMFMKKVNEFYMLGKSYKIPVNDSSLEVLCGFAVHKINNLYQCKYKDEPKCDYKMDWGTNKDYGFCRYDQSSY